MKPGATIFPPAGTIVVPFRLPSVIAAIVPPSMPTSATRS